MRYSPLQRLAYRTSIAILICSLSACGFKLRNDYQLAQQLQQVQLSSSERHAKLQSTLAQRLIFLDVSVNQDTSSFRPQVATLILQPEKLERKLLSLFPSGQVAEYELLYQVTYSYLPADATGTTEANEFEFVLSREYQDDPDQVLAKSRELELILDELREQAAQRIIRTLSLQTQTNANS